MLYFITHIIYIYFTHTYTYIHTYIVSRDFLFLSSFLNPLTKFYVINDIIHCKGFFTILQEFFFVYSISFLFYGYHFLDFPWDTNKKFQNVLFFISTEISCYVCVSVSICLLACFDISLLLVFSSTCWASSSNAEQHCASKELEGVLSAAGHVGLSPGWGTEKELCTKSELGLCLRPFPCVYEQVVGLQAERPQTEWKDFKEGTRTQRAVIVFPKWWLNSQRLFFLAACTWPAFLTTAD